jgi:hypothetical protein
MLDHAGGEIQPPDLLMDHLFCKTGEDKVNLVAASLTPAKMMEETLEVNRSAGSGGGKDKAHDGDE